MKNRRGSINGGVKKVTQLCLFYHSSPEILLDPWFSMTCSILVRPCVDLGRNLLWESDAKHVFISGLWQVACEGVSKALNSNVVVALHDAWDLRVQMRGRWLCHPFRSLELQDCVAEALLGRALSPEQNDAVAPTPHKRTCAAAQLCHRTAVRLHNSVKGKIVRAHNFVTENCASAEFCHRKLCERTILSPGAPKL